MKFPFIIHPLWTALALTGCVNTGLPPAEGPQQSAVLHLKEADTITMSAQERAALYLESAREAQALLGSPASAEAGRIIYNQAAADLTVLLRNGGNGKMWNRPQTFTSGGSTYRLRFAAGAGDGVWNPAYFTDFKPASEVEQGTIHHRNHQDGFGGALVGIHKTDPREPFAPLVGVTAPVTAVLDFKGNDVTLSLIDPAMRTKGRVAGAERVLDADFSAPLAYYPQRSEVWDGLMGAIHVDAYMKNTGLYMLQPYDPDRIPLIFVHGLISTPQMWRNVINEIESDPKLRGRYQCWVFGYPTGNPPAYSAYRLREELVKLHQLHPNAKPYVMVGHSMGGIVSRMQASTVTRPSWDVVGKDKADKFFAKVSKGSLVEQCTTFNANPDVGRLVFICTPHRGSEMAVGSLGELAIRLISLPVDLTAAVSSSVGGSMVLITGDAKRMPNSVTGLAPTNPMLKVLDHTPMTAPYHTIAGDQGKGNTPNSSDGVVNYWSSHVNKSQSELIVPGPHGSCELPETLTELRRILHLHLKQNGGDSISPRSKPTKS
ncbi:MAG: alpha/beta fold hydrolase [Verrucomicrobiota bacterium]